MAFYRDMICETVTLSGDQGTPIDAYTARPDGAGPFPAVVVVHHVPGWSEYYIDTTRYFAHHGYIAICANLYCTKDGFTPDQLYPDLAVEKRPSLWLSGDVDPACNTKTLYGFIAQAGDASSALAAGLSADFAAAVTGR